MRLIDADKAIGLLKTRLYETALNNADGYCSAAYLYKECADNRIETWIDEVPTIEPDMAEWISVDCESYDKVICSKLYKECADNRIETWIDEAPTIEPDTAEWISVDCESYDKVICSKCGNEPIDKEDDAFYWLTPYCPFCGRKIIKINLK